MNASDFDYDLPQERIAQVPASCREGSRLLVYHRQTKKIEHRGFIDLPRYLVSGDVLVLNNSKVLRARLRGNNAGQGGGGFELLLLEENSKNDWWVLLRPGRRARVGTRIELRDRHKRPASISGTVVEINSQGHRRLQFTGADNISDCLDQLGEMPVPPYIRRDSQAEKALDEERYQTVYASAPGSVAAPTAGLHFTAELLDQARQLGVVVASVTLHVGLGTFAPVKVEHLDEHPMHEERFFLDKELVQQLHAAKARGARVIPVGTTSLRALESVAAAHENALVPGAGRTRLFIQPPCSFRVADALLTNFHLPRSTLLMLVSAFASPGATGGVKEILHCYTEAIRLGYRFFSYGDAMLIL